MLHVTFFGTTTLLFDDGKDQILFDANFTRPSLTKYICGIKVSTDTALCDKTIRTHHIDRLRAIFVSHTHHDHVIDVPYMANRCGAVVYGSRSAENVAVGGGVSKENIVVFQDGSEFSIGEYRVRVMRSLHAKPFRLADDLGVPITEPLRRPAKLRDYKEGGSYEFYVEHGEKKIMIRPSFNYIEGHLDGIKADTMFLCVAGLAKADKETEEKFFAETVERTGAVLVIPLHWDDFFEPLDKPFGGIMDRILKRDVIFSRLAKYCEVHGVNYLIQYPCTSIDL